MDYYQFKEVFIQAIEKLLEVQVLGGLGGILGLVAGFALAYAFRRFLKPLIQYVFRKLHALASKKKAEKKIEEIKNAKTDKQFDDAVDRMFD